MGNLIGEPINGEILKQIDNRQKIHGAGYNSESVKRDPQVLNYLNNRNAWIKMASGVSIDGEIGKEKLKDIFAQSPDQNYTNSLEGLTDIGLAKKLVLFNTIQSFNDNKYTSRSGVRQDNVFSNNMDKMYGGLGGNSQGLQPIGGITDFTVESLGRGSIRKATVNIKVYNKFQFNLIELLYLRLGYIMILEWGWDKYVKDIVNIKDSPNTPPKVTLEKMGPTIIETDWFNNNTHTQQSMLKLLHKKRIETQGNYDAFFGKVSNFSWKVNKDGSYDIKVDLITLGSVIESINVRKPSIDISTKNDYSLQKQLAKEFNVEVNSNGQYDNSLINNIGTNVISQWLGQTLLNFPFNNNFFNLNNSSERYLGEKNKVPKTQRYYIRLGHFLDNLQEKILRDIKNGDEKSFKPVKIDTSQIENRCNYILNLIPLDPRICIFDFKFSDDFNEKSYFSKEGNSFTNDVLQGKGKSVGTQPFVVRFDDGVIFGQLMNIYMNINFLQKELDSNLNDKGELSLFQYLESICKGINRCTGNITNLEPSIKDDNSIYFLEQNPIKGFDSKTVKKDTTPIEILGYNSKGESNFVKDFSFNTKITPDLMTMISIGATAEGNAASIPFNNWNKGLKNRFEEKSTEPINSSKREFGEINKYTSSFITDAKEIIENFKYAMTTEGTNLLSQDTSMSSGFGVGGNYTYKWEWLSVPIRGLGQGNLGLTGIPERDKNQPGLLQEVINEVQSIEFQNKDRQRKLIDSKKVNEENILKGINILPGDEYLTYVISAFGGDIGLNSIKNSVEFEIDVKKSNSLWYKSVTNNDFINRGINSFKKYTNDINVLEYKNSNTQSSTSGFIPVELGLTLEGLSGIKIYNKIEINQKFLPPAYPKALKFVIRGINHSVKNNIWETNIQTISTSITDQVSIIEYSDYTSSQNDYSTNNNKSIITSYPNLPLISPPPPRTTLAFSDAIKTLNSITTPSISKAVFAVLFAEANKVGQTFTSVGGHNYAGVQTDVNYNGKSIQWGGGSSKFIKARYVQKENRTERLREFAVFENNTEFLKFMVNRVSSKGFNGGSGDAWTDTYINKWWSPPSKSEYTKGTKAYNNKLNIYNLSIKRYNLYTK